MSQAVRVGVKLSQDAPIESYRRIWSIADEAGFDHCWAFDHLASIGPVGPDRPVFEGWALLGAMAAATKSTRIGLMVTGITYRNPAQLAKLAVTVDHLSGGRLEFGVGAAWAAIEHEMYGISGLDHRVGLLSEGLQILKSLWTEDRTNFAGRYFQMKDAIANPKPVQKPWPPIWIGAGGPSTLKLTARHADVWNPSAAAGASLEGAIQGSRQLDELCGEIGRDPAEIRRSKQIRYEPGGEAGVLEEAQKYREAGFTEIIIYLGGDDPVRGAELAAEKLLPEIRSPARV